MIESDWQTPYEPARATNRQLADDWRLFIAAIANLEQGKSEPFTAKDVFEWARPCIKEVARRVKSGKMQYQIAKSKSGSYEKLWREVSKHLSEGELQTLQQVEGDSYDIPAIYIVSPQLSSSHSARPCSAVPQTLSEPLGAQRTNTTSLVSRTSTSSRRRRRGIMRSTISCPSLPRAGAASG